MLKLIRNCKTDVLQFKAFQVSYYLGEHLEEGNTKRRYKSPLHLENVNDQGLTLMVENPVRVYSKYIVYRNTKYGQILSYFIVKNKKFSYCRFQRHKKSSFFQIMKVNMNAIVHFDY